MHNNNDSEKPQAKLIEIVKGEVLRLKVPIERPDTTGLKTVFFGSVNSYLVRSEKGRWVIIDPGFCTKTGVDAWSKVIKELGIGPDGIEYILITHYHPDHSGMAGWFSQRTNVPVYMHAKDISAYVNELAGGAKSAENELRQMREYGMNGQMASLVEAQVKTRSLFVCGHKDFLPMDDGSEFPVGGGKLQVVYTPGHSDGHCVLLWPEKGILFSADLLMPAAFAPISLRYFGDRNPVRTFLATLSDFANRDDDNLTILPGHGWPFDGPAERAKLEAEYYLQRGEWCYRKCAQGMDTAWEIALELYREHGGKRRIISIMGEAMAYMEYLAENGRVVRKIHADGMHFMNG